ncbi:molybdopterin molybdotransferase MoeA [Salinibacterium sp. M195]|nr:molybdopterin molybdotransferase MoeA [Salinibacterium sp. M195]
MSIDEHRERILATVSPLAPVWVSLADALNLTLAADVLAKVDVPSFDNSAMDGYALRRADVSAASAESPVRLKVVADLAAGSAENPPLRDGETARIMTGAAVPADADCIVPIEDTDCGTDTVLISRAPKPAAHIRRTATDVHNGQTVLTAGRVLGPRDLAAAAATGSSELLVHRPPRVGVLSTGSELRAPGEPLSGGQIHDSNSLLLAALVTQAGAVAIQLGSVLDDEDALRAVLEEHAAHVDVFITSGGVSVGAYDIVRHVLAPLGVWFGPVRMQPGKPQGFGRLPRASGDGDGPAIFALPGNPVSVFVSFETFVRPALLTLAGRTQITRDTVVATVSTGWQSPAGRAQYMPAVVSVDEGGTPTVRPATAGGAGSYLVASLAHANALAFVPHDITDVREGQLLAVTLVT